jgi:hypothetical protein
VLKIVTPAMSTAKTSNNCPYRIEDFIYDSSVADDGSSFSSLYIPIVYLTAHN